MKRSKKVLNTIKRYKVLYIMLIPVVLYYLVFKYYPMYGNIIAFKDFKLSKGIIGSYWVGFKYFSKLFSSYEFTNVLFNTLRINLLSIIFSFPAPIMIALMLNEIKNNKVKRAVQTTIYIPYFVTWSVMGGILNTLLSPTIGIPAYLSNLLNTDSQNTIYIMGNATTWLITYIVIDIWKNAGWGSIVYMAAISNINPELYEAAKIDGANKVQMMWHITVKQISTLIFCMFILKMGKILSVGFEQVYALQNNMVLSVGEVFSTFEYKIGLGKTIQYSYSTTIGLFQGMVGLITLVVSNKLVKKISGGEIKI